MAEYKIVNSEQLDADLAVVANAIREKGGTNGSLSFPEGMKQAIENITSSGDSFKGAYNSDISYSKGDVVTYNGDVYQFDTDYSFDNPMPWTKLNTNSGGGSFQGEYDHTRSYAAGDIVACNGDVYQFPSTPPSGLPSQYIGEYATKLNTNSGSYKGAYNSDISYSVGDVVTYDGDVYQFDTDYNMPWTKLNTGGGDGGSSGGSSDIIFVIPAGTYEPINYDYYPYFTPSFNSLLPSGYSVTADISGHATTAFGELISFNKIEMSYKEISLYLGYYLNAKWLGHNHLYDGGYKSITIDTDTEVNSIFYLIFMELYSAL